MSGEEEKKQTDVSDDLDDIKLEPNTENWVGERLMSQQKAKRIRKHGCYSASNVDLRIKDKSGKLMKGEHDVFVMTRASKKGFVKVKTVTSLENIKKDGTREFHNSALNDVRNGKIIPIPSKQLNSNKLSGINRQSIWIHKSKLRVANNKFKYPSRYDNLIK